MEASINNIMRLTRKPLFKDRSSSSLPFTKAEGFIKYIPSEATEASRNITEKEPDEILKYSFHKWVGAGLQFCKKGLQ